MKLPIYEVFIKENEKLGLSIVDEPAIDENFIYFSEDKEIEMYFNEEQQIIKGVALIPNKLIYRNDNFGERYIYFSKQTIKNFAELLLNKKGNKFNIQHTNNYFEANLVESYFTGENNEFNVNEGSWVVSLKIKDKNLWNDIKNQKYKGFSIQGLFNSKIVELSTDKNKNSENMIELKEKLFEAINSIFFEEHVEVQEKVEEVVEEVKVEEVVEEKVEIVEEKVEVSVSDEKLQTEFNEKIDSLNKTIEDLLNKVEVMGKKLEDYGNQPINENVVTEKVANVITPKTESKATKYFEN